MKPSIRSSIAALVAISFFTSCNNETREQTTEVVTDTTTPVTERKMVNTIVNTPEYMAVTVFKVASYEKWKTSFDTKDSLRSANGLMPYVIGRGLLDTSEVLVALKLADTTKAKAFLSGPQVRKEMKKDGVLGQPKIELLTATWQDTSNVGSIPRSMSVMTVKNWDTWVQQFMEGRAQLEANGIKPRVIGHGMTDNKRVVLVTALADTAAAFAFYKSDSLKNRMERSGVVDPPKRFAFTISQRN